MFDTNSKLILEMEKAEHALFVHADGLITKEVLNACLSLVDRGIALELFLDLENQQYLEENVFLLNKCTLLVNKGGSIFLVSNFAELRYWQCLVDFREYSYFSLKEERVLHHEEQDVPYFKNALSEFEKKRLHGKPYLVEKDDIEINMNISDSVIMLGDPVEVYWEVKGAEKVIVQGIGRVEAYGKKKIRFDKNTIIKIGASNERQARIKAMFVKVSDDLKIHYDIGFIGEGTRQYCSLVNSDIHPHVYGISKGNKVRITWEVPLAKDVKIMPFEILKSKGEHVFLPQESLTIEIHGTIKERVYIRKIHVLVFPIPVFREKMISIASFKNKKLEIPALQLSHHAITQIRKESKEKYFELTQKLDDFYFKESRQKINLSNVLQFFFKCLVTKYDQRKDILKEIKSIQSYYDHSASGTRND